MSCCPCQLDIERSLDGAPADGAAPVEAHLDECPLCRSRAAAIEATDGHLAAGILDDDGGAARVPPRLISRLVETGEREIERRALLDAAARAGTGLRPISERLRAAFRGAIGRWRASLQ